MAQKVNPFRGVRYNKKAVGNDFTSVLAPPYDVISPEYQDELYKRNDKNVVRLILEKKYDTDTDDNNRYTRSAKTLKEWMGNGTLQQDEKPALYLYAQDYEIDGEKRRRVGFICRRLIEQLGTSIHPHERTLSGPKVDRLNLTRTCQMNFSQIFGLYSDPDLYLDSMWEEIMKTEPELSETDDDGVGHHMWIVTDADVISKVQAFLEEKPVVIADGHHRYETALNYRNERRAKDGETCDAEYDFVMMYLSNTNGQGFTVLPTHRVIIEMADMTNDEILKRLEESFNITEHPFTATTEKEFAVKLAETGKTTTALGLYLGDDKIYLLAFKDGAKLPGSENDLEALRRLDVTILQDLIFEDYLGVKREDVASKKAVKFMIDAMEVKKMVDDKAARAVFLMNSTNVDQIIDVATNGGVMPQKSTYFYPKLISGFVFNPLA
ncbi:Related to HTH domain of SpoOJ/ParA/ParB/repB family, involved in chromosome partitioning [hydrothermal vent metagenome]|uniref:Related to HTH domain of SpoOJ/ParA/ParB/repB family, involved in chromosome partitioning n=1 Tax=hydrothermal vent metagenome TaxID=652676 RepID=A0A3B1C3J6_9ZZZZ